MSLKLLSEIAVPICVYVCCSVLCYCTCRCWWSLSIVQNQVWQCTSRLNILALSSYLNKFLKNCYLSHTTVYAWVTPTAC